ncbi:hypothetical protein SAMN05216603_12346 [Pseudomonas benzenivorans]|nr:hypothetical protein SAMN05216603_12346 [Pseudomonas benzenivorans]
MPATRLELSAAADTTRTFGARSPLGGDSTALAIGSTISLCLEGGSQP